MEFATWVLVCATIGLFAATVVLAFSTWRYTTAAKKLVKAERLSIINDMHQRVHEVDADGWINMDTIGALIGHSDVNPSGLINELREKLDAAYKKLTDDMLKDIQKMD